MTLNAGKYNKKVRIFKVVRGRDAQGFQIETNVTILEPYASVKTTKGFTMIANNSDFEKAYTNFTIRYSQTVVDTYYESDNSNRDMFIEFRGKKYSIEYLSNINEANVELEMQAKEVMK